jgi:hypothetical protein
MKKVFLSLVMLMAGIAINAQDNPLTNGVYEKKVVVTADSVKASALYVRALEALSDWAGSNANSKMGIDVQDKDESLIVYKGNVHLGFEYYSKFAGAGWDFYIDMTINVNFKIPLIHINFLSFLYRHSSLKYITYYIIYALFH